MPPPSFNRRTMALESAMLMLRSGATDRQAVQDRNKRRSSYATELVQAILKDNRTRERRGDGYFYEKDVRTPATPLSHLLLLPAMKDVSDRAKNRAEDVYMSRNIKEELSLDPRRSLPPLTEEGCRKATPEIVTRRGGDKVLVMNGHDIMGDYQKIYMELLADIAIRNGGDVLNVGHGMNLVDGRIAEKGPENGITSRTIIELNDYVAEQARERHPNARVMNDSWQSAIKTLSLEGKKYSCVIYDAYPLSVQELKRDATPFLRELVRSNMLNNGAIVTFYMDVNGIGNINPLFTQYLQSLGFSVEYAEVELNVPDDRQHCGIRKFVAPKLTYTAS